jgi:monoterpene epsilon-lactone hydrolase
MMTNRKMPLPVSISPVARASLEASAAQPMGAAVSLALDDAEGWAAQAQFVDAMLLAMMRPEGMGDMPEIDLGGAAAHQIDVAQPKYGAKRGFYLHGGGLTFGAGQAGAWMAKRQADTIGLPMVSIDYRMPPAFPYPAGLDDCMAAYRAAIATTRPEDIVIMGASAGGQLAAAMVLRARDEGLPMPGGLVLMTPEVDLTESGDSFTVLLGVDPVLTQSLMPANLLYAGGADLAHPYLSPLFGDFSKGFPRTFLQGGTRDLFLSNSVRMHRALRQHGLPAELHVFEGMPHGGFGGSAPEDHDLSAEISRFIKSLP